MENMKTVEFTNVDESTPSTEPALPAIDVDLFKDLQAEVEVKIGNTKMSVGQLFNSKQGDVIKLEQSVDADVELVLGEQVVAKGQLVAVEGNFGLKITHIAAKD
ncbi:FliM/FliN family flagellar motor switch protein [Pseudoalteromonas sp. SMS1]|uniref:FliM/FliN family flagellar motor switch protein n=1 Tax=Pseudoalteromonas sp. SMS1 TaxID=2908894 RepID=UPI001F1D2330|nr:FliM/FliN family flagellar motor switch protein [Pseudoalteromonas sp. SMS1]MCF2860231.1 FliM/FliN family flagellar motor switch protein [Pseudoalteromonas sp. SMS1]